MVVCVYTHLFEFWSRLFSATLTLAPARGSVFAASFRRSSRRGSIASTLIPDGSVTWEGAQNEPKASQLPAGPAEEKTGEMFMPLGGETGSELADGDWRRIR